MSARPEKSAGNAESDDEIMAEALADAAAASEEVALRAQAVATENNVDIIRNRLENLELERRNLGIEYDARTVAMAHADVNAFLNHVADAGRAQLAACEETFTNLMVCSAATLVRQLDGSGVRSFFIPTEGMASPYLTFSVHRDGRVARLQRWNRASDESMTPGWEIYFGPVEELRNVCYRAATPSMEWMTSLVEWSQIAGNIQTATPPTVPLLLQPSTVRVVPAPGSNTQPPAPPIAVDNLAASTAPLTSGVQPRRPGGPIVAEHRPSEKRGPSTPELPAPKRRPSLDPSDPRVARVLHLIGSSSVPSTGSELPAPRAAFFCYGDGFDNHVVKMMRSEDYVGKKTILLIGTSVIAHFRLSAIGNGLFCDFGGSEPRTLLYPRYDMSHLQEDDEKTVIFQVGLSGYHSRYGPFPRDANAIRDFIETCAFRPVGDFRYDYVFVQNFTNDVNFATRPSSRRSPSTDIQVFDEAMRDARELGAAFKPKSGTGALGLGTPKWRHTVAHLESVWKVRNDMRRENRHKLLHRVAHLMEQASRDDVRHVQRNRVLTFVHTPMLLHPPTATIFDAERLGHLLAKWMGDLAFNVQNSMRNGVRMLTPGNSVSLLHCYGEPRRFSSDLRSIRPAIHPMHRHRHGDRDCSPIPATTTVLSAAQSNASDLGTWYSFFENVTEFGDLAWTFW